jgi:hypothetical protein
MLAVKVLAFDTGGTILESRGSKEDAIVNLTSPIRALLRI